MHPALSVVVPVFNEAGNIAPLYREIHAVLTGLSRSFEIIYVNDGSGDATRDELLALATNDGPLRVVDLDGNYGEAAALCAGFAAARGELVITLDGDGQNDPADIPRLLQVLEAGGYRVVTGWRRERREAALLRVLPSRLANLLIRWVTGIPMHDNGCGLKIYRRSLLQAATLAPGFHRFLPAILGITAAEVAEVPVNDRRRQHGHSHYGIGRVVVVARDLLAVPFLISVPEAGAGYSLAVATMALIYGLLGGSIILVAVVVLSALSIGWNLRRFQEAKRRGPFRVRCLYPPDPEQS